jgi:hypothetical protein
VLENLGNRFKLKQLNKFHLLLIRKLIDQIQIPRGFISIVSFITIQSMLVKLLIILGLVLSLFLSFGLGDLLPETDQLWQLLLDHLVLSLLINIVSLGVNKCLPVFELKDQLVHN